MRRLLPFLLALPMALPAQDRFVKPNQIRASGEATVTVRPDRARITIGVTNQNASAQTAAAENATQTNKVIDAMKRVLGEGGELKTIGYSLTPQYAYAQGKAPKATGYQANNTVEVTVNDLSLLGKVIDAANETGANNIGGVTFSLKDESAVRNEALGQAAAKARAAGEAMAKALNVRVLGVLEADTSDAAPAPRPMLMARMAMAADQASTPVEPGNLDIHATVTVVLEIAR